MQQRLYKIATLATTKAPKGDSTETRKGLLPVSPATIWRWVKDGKFPRPFKIGANSTCWDAAEVDAWLASRKEAAQ
ncbi:AlpA Predicted transcriptional regulator [Burkholderiaceae bacterium]